MNSALRIAAVAAAWLALGCGAPMPPTEEARSAPEPVTVAPAVADADEETVFPEGQPAAQGTETAATEGAAAGSESPTAESAPSPPEVFVDQGLLKKISAAEEKASPEGRLVLETGRKMALVDREVILGACWDYANTVYKRAGFPSNKRKTIFNHSKKGPFADPGLFKPGDFLSYSHDEKGEWVHSAIFVDWSNAAEHLALMLSYPGGKRPVPAYYSHYELSRVFRVVRPKP